MKMVFRDLNYTTLYERCVMASVMHAIMVGKYNLLSAEQSWDGLNYIFQNMEGVRGVISFYKNRYVCVIQNNVKYKIYTEYDMIEVLHGVDAKTIDLTKEALQYMLADHKGKVVTLISTAFWGDEKVNFSNFLEEQIIKVSENTIMPFLLYENDAKMYWKDYYEMTDEQIKLAEDIYIRRIYEKGKIYLSINEINKLKEWFGDIDECIESFQELNIYLD